MWSYKNSKRISLNLLCIVVCILFTGCAGPISGINGAKGSGSGEYVISVPETITMEFFGKNLFQTNRSIWEKYIYSIYNVGQDDHIGTRIPIGEYEVMHSYLNFENEKNFSATVTYKDDFGGSQILFDENGNLNKIDIRRHMGEEFNTTFLNIGDNVKDFFESTQKGSWKKFLKSDSVVTSSGWNIRHATAEATDFTYDDLQVFNKDIYISYLIKDEVVDHILVYIIGDLTVSEDTAENSASLYDLDLFQFYINDKSISQMSGSDWVNLLGSSSEEIFKKFFDFSSTNSVTGNYSEEASLVVDGQKMRLGYAATEDYHEMFLIGESRSEAPFSISFSLNREGNYFINLFIFEDCPFITGNYIMPGDNIRTFLNSYEDGLYEKIMSLSASAEEYCVGPYYFQRLDSSDGESTILLGKNDERASMPVSITFKNEIVTYINRNYSGTVPGFDSEPSLW